MSMKGIVQQDIPKLLQLIAAGHDADAIAAGMLGYRCPAAVIQTFIDRGPVTEVEKRAEHPQDRAYREREEIRLAQLQAARPAAGKNPAKVAAGVKGAATRAAKAAAEQPESELVSA